MPGRSPVAGVALGVALAVTVLVAKLGDGDRARSTARGAAERGGLTRPIAPAHQLDVPWGTYSHWIQPWRAWLDTVPAATMRDAVGINFNVSAGEAPATAALLRSAGVRRARVEVGWGSFSYDDPGRMAPGDAASLRTTLGALQRNGIRPLLLLNANQGQPCPLKRLQLEVTAPASAGDRTIRLSPASAGAVVPRFTGLDGIGEYKAAAWIITSVDDAGEARLAKPLDRDLPAGTYDASTLRYLPFARPYRTEGSREPNPEYQATLRGWLGYADAVAAFARDTVGGDGFDLEIWNEPSFGSDFLDTTKYFADSVDVGAGDITDALPRATVSHLRDRPGRLKGVGIANGFESQRPGASGATSPPGLTAISKHPYAGRKRYPKDAEADGNRPVNALGRPEGKPDGQGQWRQAFVPRYDALFPEWFLSALQTESLVRDLSPITTSVFGHPHGRNTHPPGAPPPRIWLTEINLDPGGADLSTPGQQRRSPLTAAEQRHVQAKSVLRYLSAYVSKGVTAIYFYAAKAGGLSLIAPSFFSPDAGQTVTAGAGGETIEALQRFTRAFDGPPRLRAPRRLSLVRIADHARHVQFAGDGTAAHPPLYNRDVLAVLPFQTDARRFVIPVYVMTRDVTRRYPGGGRRSPFARLDLPPETYDLTIGGLRGCRLRASMLDPLAGTRPQVQVRSCGRGRVTVRLQASDSPRLLTLEER